MPSFFFPLCVSLFVAEANLFLCTTSAVLLHNQISVLFDVRTTCRQPSMFSPLRAVCASALHRQASSPGSLFVNVCLLFNNACLHSMAVLPTEVREQKIRNYKQ